MANSKYKAEVVRYLRKKTNGGYTEAPTYLGSEQKFVGALRNSNDNNLEEQFLLGTDCLTTEWEDNGNSYIRKEERKYSYTHYTNNKYSHTESFFPRSIC